MSARGRRELMGGNLEGAVGTCFVVIVFVIVTVAVAT